MFPTHLVELFDFIGVAIEILNLTGFRQTDLTETRAPLWNQSGVSDFVLHRQKPDFVRVPPLENRSVPSVRPEETSDLPASSISRY